MMDFEDCEEGYIYQCLTSFSVDTFEMVYRWVCKYLYKTDKLETMEEMMANNHIYPYLPQAEKYAKEHRDSRVLDFVKKYHLNTDDFDAVTVLLGY